jgi:hypothetical protein
MSSDNLFTISFTRVPPTCRHDRGEIEKRNFPQFALLVSDCRQSLTTTFQLIEIEESGRRETRFLAERSSCHLSPVTAHSSSSPKKSSSHILSRMADPPADVCGQELIATGFLSQPHPHHGSTDLRETAMDCCPIPLFNS